MKCKTRRFAHEWRPDNKLILTLKVPKGGAAYTGKVFDLNTKKLNRLSSTGPLRSADGLWLTQLTATSKNSVCEYSEDSWWRTDGAFQAAFPSEYSIIDPVTQSKKGTIVAGEKIVQPITFSKDNNEILYRVIDLPKKPEGCSDYLSNRYPAPYVYYIKDLTSEKVTLVDDYESVLASWRADTTNAAEEPYDKTNLSVIAKYYE